MEKVWVARNPPGFAFVEFKDPRDADDAIRDLDGKYVVGTEISHWRYLYLKEMEFWNLSKHSLAHIAL